MLGSAQVIKAPNVNANTITIQIFFCLDKDEPMYSPTLTKLDEAPIWKIDKPTINIINPANNNQ